MILKNINNKQADIQPSNGEAVTVSDSTEVDYRGLYIGGAGAVVVVFLGDDSDTAVTFAGVPAGTILPIQVKKVMSTNTTATNIVGFTVE